MDKHLNILKQLYRWYWDSDIGGVPHSKWKQLTLFDKRNYIKKGIYHRLKYDI